MNRSREDGAEVVGMAITPTDRPDAPITGLMGSSDPAAIAAAEQARARIQMAYFMAYQNPRNEEKARDKILRACRRLRFAEKAVYKKPVGGRRVSGPSVRFAEHALASWGNCLTDSVTVYDDDEKIRIKIMVIDLESNAAHSKEKTISKTVERRSSRDREVLRQRVNTNGEIVYIVRATDEEIENKIASAVSKSVRNEGLRLIPVDIVDEALYQISETVSKRINEDPDAAKREILDGFSRHLNVKPEEVEKYLGHKLDIVTPAELLDLREVFQAVREGATTWADVTAQADGERGVDGTANAIREKAKKAKESAARDGGKKEPDKEKPGAEAKDGKKTTRRKT